MFEELALFELKRQEEVAGEKPEQIEKWREQYGWRESLIRIRLPAVIQNYKIDELDLHKELARLIYTGKTNQAIWRIN